MPTFYNFPTALQIYEAIAKGGDQGLDLEQLQALLPSPKIKGGMMARNTIRTYCRWLEDGKNIRVDGINSDTPNKAIKNVYVAIKKPTPKQTEKERLKEIERILKPFAVEPEVWDRGYKLDIMFAIKCAIHKANG